MRMLRRLIVAVSVVNSQLVADHGVHTGARPGLVLRGPGYRDRPLRAGPQG